MSRDRFVVGCTHLGHGNVLKHAQRPWPSIEGHDEALISNWNSEVRQSDTTVILGDFAWKDHARYLQRLNGKKILIVGSHDRMPQDALRLFHEVHPGAAMLQFGNARPLWCSHCCFRVWEKSHYGVGHVFSHSHGRLETWNMSCDAGVDSGRMYKKYFPIPIEEVFAWMVLREAEMRAAGRIVQTEQGKDIYRQDDAAWLASHSTLTAKGEQ